MPEYLDPLKLAGLLGVKVDLKELTEELVELLALLRLVLCDRHMWICESRSVLAREQVIEELGLRDDARDPDAQRLFNDVAVVDEY